MPNIPMSSSSSSSSILVLPVLLVLPVHLMLPVLPILVALQRAKYLEVTLQANFEAKYRGVQKSLRKMLVRGVLVVPRVGTTSGLLVM